MLKIIKDKTLFRFHLKALLLLAGLFFTLPDPAAAAASNACDPKYMDALESRAYLEAQREIAQNQNLILKPDSVLSYICFENLVSAVATDMASQFVPIDVTDIDSVIAAHVGGFSGKILGDRGSYDSTNTCMDMNKIWEEATCMNMFDEDRDQFFDFGSSSDPRTGACPTPDPTIDKALTSAFGTADDATRFKYYTVSTGKTTTEGLPAFDKYDPHLDKILPKGHALAPTCADPIKTGITVKRVGFTPAEYPDAVCPNPGCYYDPGSGSCK